MKTLTDLEAKEWCQQWPLRFTFDRDGLLCAPTEGVTYRVDISEMRWRDVVSTATALAFLDSRTLEQFSGGLLWVRRTGIASPDWEVVVLRTFERFRLGYGETRSLETVRAQLFRRDESSECAGALLLVLLAEWDAYFVHPSGDWVAFIDNDDHVTVTTRNVKIGEELKESLDTWGPTTAQPVPRRF